MARIDAPDIAFDAQGLPTSRQFGDIYFSPTTETHDGLAETQTVFLQGNNLPAFWQDVATGGASNQHRNFTIAETGFGTGLNFLATVELFEQTALASTHLHFISVERYPLSREELRRTLQPWYARFPQAVDRLIETYPPRLPGFHRVWFSDRITLTLIFDDAIAGFGGLDASVDAWFLDGFAPAKNPGMWQDALYQQMARLSHAGTTLASFTAAGDVRRGLQAAGFTIERHSGFANKRHRITGIFASDKTKPSIGAPRRVAIIGAGLAGATMAQALRRHNVACTIFDRHPQPGLNASGNRLGLVNPKIDLGHPAVGDLGHAMYSLALHRLHDLPDIGLQQNGSFHTATDTVKMERQRKIINTLDWLPGHLQAVTADETRDQTGLALSQDGLFFADAVTVDTSRLVERLLHGVDINWNNTIADLATLTTDFDHIVIASSEAARQMFPQLNSILQPMRGQVTYLKAPMPGLACPIIAGHYVAPVDVHTWVTGATFQRERTDTVPQAGDDAENLATLRNLIPGLPDAFEITGQWAQIRYTTPDRRPVLGLIADDVTLCTALGSHGLQYSFLLAEILTARLCGAPMPVSVDVLKILDLQRYKDKLA